MVESIRAVRVHHLAESYGEGRLVETATLGGGCFWCLHAVFVEIAGVASVRSGYAGGELQRPDYKAVCRGDSGHAEVVEIRFDPGQISYRKLLEVFFAIHDPTTLNRQGGGRGNAVSFGDLHPLRRAGRGRAGGDC